MDDLLMKVLVRLVSVQQSLGDRTFENAAHRALIGIGAAVKEEAELRSHSQPGRAAGTIVRFPLGRTGQSWETREIPSDSDD